MCLKLVSPRDISKPKLKFIHQLMKDNLNKREEEIKLALKDFFGYFRYQKVRSKLVRRVRMHNFDSRCRKSFRKNRCKETS